jgi:hypothetical protein
MNIKKIIFILLLAACKPNVPSEVKNDKKSIAPKDSITQVTQRKQLTNLTFPRVWFGSDLENVMLRDTPIVSLSKNNLVFTGPALFLGQKSTFKESISIRSVSNPKYWFYVIESVQEDYTIQNDTDVRGWVYGGCVRPLIFDFSEINNYQNQSAETTYWLTLEKIDSVTFKNSAIKPNLLLGPKDTVAGADNKVSVVLAGRDTVIQGNSCDCGDVNRYNSFKELPDWYFFSVTYYEWEDCIFIRKSDGKIFHSNGRGDDILISPDKSSCAFISGQGYGNRYTNGFEIFNLKTGGYVAFQFGRDVEVRNIQWTLKNEILFEITGKDYKSEYYRIKNLNIF